MEDYDRKPENEETPNKQEKGHSKERTIPQISRNESIFLSISNILIIGTLIIDLLYLSGIYYLVDLFYIAVGNLIVTTVAYFSYRVKRKIRQRSLKETKNIE